MRLRWTGLRCPPTPWSRVTTRAGVPWQAPTPRDLCSTLSRRRCRAPLATWAGLPLLPRLGETPLIGGLHAPKVD